MLTIEAAINQKEHIVHTKDLSYATDTILNQYTKEIFDEIKNRIGDRTPNLNLIDLISRVIGFVPEV